MLPTILFSMTPRKNNNVDVENRMICRLNKNAENVSKSKSGKCSYTAFDMNKCQYNIDFFCVI